MARRNLNLYGGSKLNDAEDLELRQNVEDNFGDLYCSDRNYADELTAAKNGVTKGMLYHTNGAVKVRYQDIPVPDVGRLSLTGYSPTVVQVMIRRPAVAALALTGQTPIVRQAHNVTPGTGSLGLTGAAPAVS
jgi:hypothetical protein